METFDGMSHVPGKQCAFLLRVRQRQQLGYLWRRARAVITLSATESDDLSSTTVCGLARPHDPVFDHVFRPAHLFKLCLHTRRALYRGAHNYMELIVRRLAKRTRRWRFDEAATQADVPP